MASRQSYTDQWNRVYDKMEEVREKIGETNVELAQVSQKMADHVESDTDWFARMDNNFANLHKQLNELCLSKKEARRISGWTSAIIAFIGTVITACATIIAAG